MPKQDVKSPTIIHIARKAGVNKSTVSRALRNSPLIAKPTKKKIQALARKMGYRPNMVFSIMGSGNRIKGSKANMMPLAYLYDCDKEGESTLRKSGELTSLTDTARKYGYSLDMYNLEEVRSVRKFEVMLYQMGYCGIIIGRITRENTIVYGLELDKFTVIFNTNTSWEHKYHRVLGDAYRSVQMAWDNLLASGYRRIGAAICHHQPTLPDDSVRLAAVLERQNRDAALVECIPPFTGSTGDLSAFKEWFEKWRPDAVLGFSIGHYYHLKETGYRIPEDIGFASLHLHPEDKWCKGISGIRIQDREVSETTISVLDQEIRKRIHGIPEHMLFVHIEPEWVEGKTLRKVR